MVFFVKKRQQVASINFSFFDIKTLPSPREGGGPAENVDFLDILNRRPRNI